MAMNSRLLRPLASFDPRSIAGLAAWFDAADSSTVTTATGVSEWRSKVGGIAVTQATGATQPTISSISGRQAFDFSGSQGLTLASSALAAGKNGLTHFVVFEHDNASTANYESLVDLNTASNADKATLYARSSTVEAGGRRLDADSYQFVQSGAVSNGVAVLAGAVFDYGNATLTAFNNGAGVARTGGFQTAGASTNTNGSFSIGCNVGSTELNGFFNGRIGEVLVFDRALSVSERQLVEGYLAWKWN